MCLKVFINSGRRQNTEILKINKAYKFKDDPNRNNIPKSKNKSIALKPRKCNRCKIRKEIKKKQAAIQITQNNLHFSSNMINIIV